jgi:hypothetical protein
MVLRWRWATLVCFLVLGWVGCSGSSQKDPVKPGAAGKANSGGKGPVAGKGGAGTGGSSAEGGEAGLDGQGGTGGTGATGATGATGGTSGRGGAGGRASVGGAGGVGAFGGIGAVSGSGLIGGNPAGGQGGVPFGWKCGTETYGDGVCHCGCNASDPDCEHNDIDECEVCDAVGSCNGAECPGRINEDNTVACLPPAVGWYCDTALYGDGESCDCGCGTVDIDCDDETVESCDVCDALSACSNLSCPGTIDPENNARCYHPAGWTCYWSLYGDGFCDCGCGVIDLDCADATPESCKFCPSSGCTPFDCTDTLLPDNNAICSAPPSSWTCPTRLYNDGDQCDCGCGFIDPDCASGELSACDKCNGEGSCSGQACPGIINEKDNSICMKPPAPDDWTCYDYQYGDGYYCDCGCGVQDADCRTAALGHCERCSACGFSYYCPGLVNPDDTTECVPAPDGWECNDERYADGVCDCGCGILDADCSEPPYTYCGRCPDEGCAHGRCDRIDPDEPTECLYDTPAEWTCGNYFFDGVCDCGCGALDVDCIGTTIAACDSCDTPGSCSTTNCPGTILSSNIATCTP